MSPSMLLLLLFLDSPLLSSSSWLRRPPMRPGLTAGGCDDRRWMRPRPTRDSFRRRPSEIKRFSAKQKWQLHFNKMLTDFALERSCTVYLIGLFCHRIYNPSHKISFSEHVYRISFTALASPGEIEIEDEIRDKAIFCPKMCKNENERKRGKMGELRWRLFCRHTRGKK